MKVNELIEQIKEYPDYEITSFMENTRNSHKIEFVKPLHSSQTIELQIKNPRIFNEFEE